MNALLLAINVILFVWIFILIKINYQTLKDIFDMAQAINASQETTKKKINKLDDLIGHMYHTLQHEASESSHTAKN